MKILVLILASILSIVPGGKAYLKQLQPRDSILIADQLEYGFSLDSVKAGTTLALPQLDLPSRNDTMILVRGWQIDTVKTFKVGKRKNRAKYYKLDGSIVISPYEPGIYMLPQLSVQRTLETGQVDTLTFDPLDMDVRTLPVDPATFVPHPPADEEEDKPSSSHVLLWVLAALVIFLVWKLLHRKNADAASSADPAYVVALKRLDKYRGDEYKAPEKQKSFYSGITDVLKFYIEDRFDIDAPEMTTSELFSELKNCGDITPALFGETRDLFETADFVKFAKHTVSEDDYMRALPTAVRFVTSTIQKEPEEGQEKENVL